MGFQFPAPNSYSFALPKRKKEFKAGRPFVSFVKAFIKPLLEATAKLLYALTALAFPNSFAQGDVYKLMAQIHEYFLRDFCLDIQKPRLERFLHQRVTATMLGRLEYATISMPFSARYSL